MALDLSFELQMSEDGLSWYIQDTTLAYSASNTGGYGSPNPELANQAMMLFVQRVTDSGNIAESILSTQIVTGLAVYDHAWQVNHSADGHYKIGMFAIPVTTDGITTADGDTIVADDIVYYNGLVQEYNGSTYAEVTDYSTLFDEAGVAQEVQELPLYPLIQIIYAQKLELYVNNRNSGDVLDQYEQEEFDEIERLRLDLEGAHYLFWSGSPTEYRDTIERLTNKFTT